MDLKIGSEVWVTHVEGRPKGVIVGPVEGTTVPDIIADGRSVLVEIEGAPMPIQVDLRNLE